MEVNIYIKNKWTGRLRGSGRAIGLIEYIDKNGECHILNVKEEVENGTKQELEIKVCIAALRALRKKCKVNIYMDSCYIENVLKNQWLTEWAKNGWTRKRKKALAHQKEWQLFHVLSQIHDISIKKYSSKYDDEINEDLSRRKRVRWQELLQEVL